MGRYALDSCDWGYGPVEGCCLHGNKPSGFIKGAADSLAEWLVASEKSAL